MDAYHSATLLGLTLFSVTTIFSLRIDFIFKISWCFFVVYGLVSGLYLPEKPLGPIDLGIKIGGLKTVLTLTILPLAFLCCRLWSLSMVARGLLILLSLDAVWMLFGGFGIFVGTTHDTLVFAIFLPMFFLFPGFRWLTPLLIAAILKLEGAASFIVCLSHLAVLVAFSGGAWLKTSALVGFLSALAIMSNEPRFWGGRFEVVWRGPLRYWGEHANQFWGFGPGSFEWISVILKDQVNGSKLWMHSDWLQVMFETGLVGLFLFTLSYMWCLFSLRRDLVGFSCFLGAGIGMLVYSPLQFLVVQFLLMFLYWRNSGETFKFKGA